VSHVRVLIIAVDVPELSYPDEGALASSVKRCLEHRHHGLATFGVTAVEVTEMLVPDTPPPSV
jgi:hypothetical protein